MKLIAPVYPIQASPEAIINRVGKRTGANVGVN